MTRLLVLFAALLVAGPAHAAPVAVFFSGLAGGLTAAVAGSLAFGTFGFALIKLGLGLALSAISKALSPKAKSNNPGIRTEVTTQGGITPQSYILGRYATAGNVVSPFYAHAPSSGKPNKFRTQIIDLSDLPITSLEAIYINGTELPLATDWSGTPHADYGLSITTGIPEIEKFVGKVWLKFYDGSQVAADPMLLAKYGSHAERPWLSDMIGTGVAYVILTYAYDTDIWQGEPTVRFECTGIPLYDPRLDGSENGTGAHRWADQSTWEFSENPAVMIYNIFRGLPLPDGGSYGLDVAGEDLPTDWWFAAMNACDETVDGAARYRAGYEVKMATGENGGDTPFDAIDALALACDMDLCDIGGTWICRVGEVALAAAAITDDDILRSSPQDLDPFRGLAETVNTLRATFPSPDGQWQPSEAPLRVDSAAVTEDGRVLVAEVTFNSVWDNLQVQRLCQAWLADARKMRRHTITLPPQYAYLMPLDADSWTSTRNGYSSKLFEIGEIAVDLRTLNITLALRERDAADYDWSAVSDELPWTAPSPVVVSPTVTVGNFTATGVTLTDANGTSRRVGVQLTWDGVPGHASLEWEIRVKVTSAAVASGSTSDFEAGSLILSEGLVPDMTYQARARGRGLATPWTAWTDFTTPSLQLTELDIHDRPQVQALDDALQASLTGIATGHAAALAQNSRISALVEQEVLTRVTEDSAMAQRIDLVSATVDDQSALIAENATASATADSALAVSISLVSATVDGHEASITTLQGATADIEGFLAATYTLRARAGGAVGEIEVVAADDPIEGAASAISFSADRFQFLDGVAMFGGALQSDDYVAGVSGWQITQAGAAEFNSLEVRQDMIVDGAVSRRLLFGNTSSVAVTSTSYADVSSCEVTFTAGRFEAFNMYSPGGGGPTQARNPLVIEVSVGVQAATVPAQVWFTVYQKISGSWAAMSIFGQAIICQGIANESDYRTLRFYVYSAIDDPENVEGYKLQCKVDTTAPFSSNPVSLQAPTIQISQISR